MPQDHFRIITGILVDYFRIPSASGKQKKDRYKGIKKGFFSYKSCSIKCEYTNYLNIKSKSLLFPG